MWWANSHIREESYLRVIVQGNRLRFECLSRNILKIVAWWWASELVTVRLEGIYYLDCCDSNKPISQTTDLLNNNVKDIMLDANCMIVVTFIFVNYSEITKIFPITEISKDLVFIDYHVGFLIGENGTIIHLHNINTRINEFLELWLGLYRNFK